MNYAEKFDCDNFLHILDRDMAKKEQIILMLKQYTVLKIRFGIQKMNIAHGI